MGIKRAEKGKAQPEDIRRILQTALDAESRSGGKSDVGPDRVEWRYSGDKFQKRRSAEEKWVTSKEKPIYRRCHRLAEAADGP